MNGKLDHRGMEVVNVVSFDDRLVEAELGRGEGRQLKDFEHDCHHHDEPIGPVFETLEILVTRGDA
jgi:hypothetical protein